MEKFIMPNSIDPKARYIICPNIKCNGFMLEHLQCTNNKHTIELFPDKHYELCPHLDKAKMVVFCYYGHPIEDAVNCSSWARADCSAPNCHSATFSRMSDTTYRIPLSKYKKFLKLPIKK